MLQIGETLVAVCVTVDTGDFDAFDRAVVAFASRLDGRRVHASVSQDERDGGEEKQSDGTRSQTFFRTASLAWSTRSEGLLRSAMLKAHLMRRTAHSVQPPFDRGYGAPASVSTEGADASRRATRKSRPGDVRERGPGGPEPRRWLRLLAPFPGYVARRRRSR